MIIHSWNVNGFRACVRKGFWDWFAYRAGDVVCLQEIKATPDQLDGDHQPPEGWEVVWNPARVKKGYSGTACFLHPGAAEAHIGSPAPQFQGEGRLIRLEFPAFHLLACYFPNGGMSDERLRFKLDYYEAFLALATELRRDKPVVICGDINTAHQDIDLKNPDRNRDKSGFMDIERAWLDRLAEAGWHDAFRLFHPDEGGWYTWWDYRFKARERNAGWRIDAFYVPGELRDKVLDCWIENDVHGSDHCPIGLKLDL
ncbi:exodeoxyribonuclease III [Desulfohalovibrio reitneri]|uniref:exodeoxyribonuclease III n=1 Tax=Desulfohalovibrio reitneri TaxID=1307759 RepID=UPI0004A6D06F|nr:exodeoxyribonuclease III [Desulfohalovibrio reitneri]